MAQSTFYKARMVFNIFLKKRTEKRPLGSARRRWEDNSNVDPMDGRLI